MKIPRTNRLKGILLAPVLAISLGAALGVSAVQAQVYDRYLDSGWHSYNGVFSRQTVAFAAWYKYTMQTYGWADADFPNADHFNVQQLDWYNASSDADGWWGATHIYNDVGGSVWDHSMACDVIANTVRTETTSLDIVTSYSEATLVVQHVYGDGCPTEVHHEQGRLQHWLSY